MQQALDALLASIEPGWGLPVELKLPFLSGCFTDLCSPLNDSA